LYYLVELEQKQKEIALKVEKEKKQIMVRLASVFEATV
jgi:hypothetical protein